MTIFEIVDDDDDYYYLVETFMLIFCFYCLIGFRSLFPTSPGYFSTSWKLSEGANLIKLWISVILLMLTPTEDNVSSNSQVIVRSAHEFYFCLSVWFFYNLFQEIVAMRRKIHFLVLPNGWLNYSFNFLHEKRKLWASLVTNANRLFAHGKFF